MKEDGLSVVKWGYFGDILTSPYVGFGLYSDNKEFFEKRNNVYVHVSFYDIVVVTHVFHCIGKSRSISIQFKAVVGGIRVGRLEIIECEVPSMRAAADSFKVQVQIKV